MSGERTRFRRTPVLKAFLTASVLAAAAAPALAGFGQTDVGSAGGQFLTLGGGARAEGMAEAYTALPTEADATYWNPAALTRVSEHSVTAMNSVLPAGINYNFLGYGQRLSNSYAAGASLQYLSQPPIDQTDSSGYSTGSTFRPSDFAGAVSAAYVIHNENAGIFDGASFGATGRYISSTITKTDHTYDFDLGFLSAPFLVLGHETRLAYVAQNLGGHLQYFQNSDLLPITLRLGTSVSLAKGWLVDLDLDEPVANNPYVAFGTEYRLASGVGTYYAVRAGVSTRAMGDTGNVSGFSLGLGARFSRIGFDYALVPLGALGMTNTVSVDFSF
jgi:hypothetical protein